MRGCVISGVWGAGKTSILRRVAMLLTGQGCESLITMPQAATITTHTYTPGAPADHAASITAWLQELTGFLEGIDRRFHTSTLPSHRFASRWTPTCVLEALGFDAPLYDLPIPRESLLSVEQRLAALGLHHVLLHVPSEKILSQCVVSTRTHRGPKWASYLNRFGENDNERARHIDHLQKHLLELGASSPLPTYVLDTGDQQWDLHARLITELIMNGPSAMGPMHHQIEPIRRAAAGSR